MMQWLDRFCHHKSFGTKITQNRVTVKKLYGFKVTGARLKYKPKIGDRLELEWNTRASVQIS
jgi:hypothetical protein